MMKLSFVLLSIVSLLTMAGLFLKECITTPLGLQCRVKTGVAALLYVVSALLLVWGLTMFGLN